MSGEPGWRTYALALGVIAVVALLTLVAFGSSTGQILQTVSKPVSGSIASSSAATISRTSSSKDVSAHQPSSRRALLASPTSRSTSA